MASKKLVQIREPSHVAADVELPISASSDVGPCDWYPYARASHWRLKIAVQSTRQPPILLTKKFGS
jgi:hypothetical protein